MAKIPFIFFGATRETILTSMRTHHRTQVNPTLHGVLSQATGGRSQLFGIKPILGSCNWNGVPGPCKFQ